MGHGGAYPAVAPVSAINGRRFWQVPTLSQGGRLASSSISRRCPEVIGKSFPEFIELIGIAAEKNLMRIPVDSVGRVSFIIEHIMNKWAGQEFTQSLFTQNFNNGQISFRRSGA
jgi:hypothetical protein